MSSPPRKEDGPAASRGAAGDPKDLLHVDPAWILAIIHTEVSRRLSSWPNRRIGAVDAKDLVQQVIVFLFEKDRAALKRFDPALGTATAYVRDFARKRMIELERKYLRREGIISPESANTLLLPGSLDTPEKWFDYIEKQNEIIHYLKTHGGPEDLDIFYLAFVEDLSNVEIAKRKEVSAEFIATRKFAVRRHVRACLEQMSDQGEKK